VKTGGFLTVSNNGKFSKMSVLVSIEWGKESNSNDITSLRKNP
jgi:hypothetical protein